MSPDVTPEERLRAAAQAFVALHDDGKLGNPLHIWCDGHCEPLKALRAALAATDRSPLPDALDGTTPRPWHAEQWGSDVALDQVCGPDGTGVAVTFEQTGLFTEADAALIVAAVNAYATDRGPATRPRT